MLLIVLTHGLSELAHELHHAVDVGLFSQLPVQPLAVRADRPKYGDAFTPLWRELDAHWICAVLPCSLPFLPEVRGGLVEVVHMLALLKRGDHCLHILLLLQKVVRVRDVLVEAVPRLLIADAVPLVAIGQSGL